MCIIRAASAGNTSSSPQDIASAVALTPDLFMMGNLPLVNAVLEVLGKVAVGGLDPPSFKAAGLDVATCKAAGFTLAEIQAAGYSVAHVLSAGYDELPVIAAYGFDALASLRTVSFIVVGFLP
jgi:hypothetical protein